MYVCPCGGLGCYTAMALWGVVLASHSLGDDLVLGGQQAHQPGLRDLLVGLTTTSGRRAEFGVTSTVFGGSACVAKVKSRPSRATLRLAFKRGKPEQRLRIKGKPHK